MLELFDQTPEELSFQLDLIIDDPIPTSFTGRFQEVTGIAMEVTIAEYRARDYIGVSKLTGLDKWGDVTLKRGIIDSQTLETWLALLGDGKGLQLRHATIRLIGPDRGKPIMTWKLHGARVIRITRGAITANDTDVAIEEILIAYERLEME
jgi:phage tail-like protein